MGSRACASLASGGRRGLLAATAATLLLLTWASPATGLAPQRSADAPDGPEEAFVFPSTRAATLPVNIVPSDYIIRIRPDYKDPLENTTDFTGEVEITFRVSPSTSQILLHAGQGIEIGDVSVSRGTTDLAVKDTGILTGTDIYQITMQSSLTAGIITPTIYTVKLAFSGKFQENMNGFYKSKYQKEDGTTGVLFTTQFQPGHARKAFPCLDEPNFKATFQLTIDVPAGYAALSNTPEDESATSVNQIAFKKTVTMSTYLVAFVLYETSSFVPSHTVITHNNIPIITWAPKDAVESRLTDYSQDVTFKILRELEDYTDIPYKRENMVKLDQVAVADFSAGAMENWGLVTYRETRLFFNETGDTEATRKSVAAVIGHELTHQWFGNLVTTTWWDTTWLNEGFARYFQYLILSRIYPSWRMMDQLLLDQQMAIFVSDSLANALPLTYDVTTATEVSGRFGSITYSKGASVVRMISYFMGEENFQKGLQQYLRRGTVAVTPSDLFKDLNDHTPDNRKPSIGFEKAMETWTLQAGFPVLHVERNYYTQTAEISQYRFYTDGTIEDEDSATTYHIPVIWSSRDRQQERFFWFSENTTLTGVSEVENYLLVHASGYYRVNYDNNNWVILGLTLASKHQALVAPADRAKLIDDALALARIGRLRYRTLGYLLRYLPYEADVLPWGAANRGLTYLDIQLGNVDQDGVFYGFLRRATKAVFEALSGFSHRGDAPELILRSTVLTWACRSGHAECLQQAVNRLALHLYDNAPLDPNLKNVILCYGSRAGGSRLWEDLWVVYKSSVDAAERSSLLTALGCIEGRDNLHAYFRRVAKGEYGANPSETRSAFQAALSHPKGIAAALDFVIENFWEMRQWLDTTTINGILRDLTDQLTSETQYQRIFRFLEDQLENDLLEDEFVDELQAKVKRNMEAVQEYAEEALEAFSDAMRQESWGEIPVKSRSAVPAPGATDASPGSAALNVPTQLGVSLAMILALGKFLY